MNDYADNIFNKLQLFSPSIVSNSYIHWKLLVGWMILILLDSLANFRFEYLYPLIMFFRSIYDSYKYQGLVSVLLHGSLSFARSFFCIQIHIPHTHTMHSLVQIFCILFVCLVAYLDLLCWSVLTGPWLFLGASSCVWLEIMRSIGLGEAYPPHAWRYCICIIVSEDHSEGSGFITPDLYFSLGWIVCVCIVCRHYLASI